MNTILAAHIEAAAAERTQHGRKVRKLKSNQQDDACVAAVLAHARARATSDGALPDPVAVGLMTATLRELIDNGRRRRERHGRGCGSHRERATHDHNRARRSIEARRAR
jgi:hypothetical protein